MRADISYGFIPLIKKSEEWHVLIVKHRTNYWGFVKGHAEPGESPLETAERELYEETGLKVSKLLYEGTLIDHYQFDWHGERIDKTVVYYLAEVQGELILQAQEIVDAKWVPLTEAENQVTFPQSQVLCHKTQTILMDKMDDMD